MPLPTPNGQSKEDFISSCMASDVMNSEYPEQAQRAAICYRQWGEKSAKSETAGDVIADLMQSIQDEAGAAADYRTRASFADPETAKVYEHIAQEEDAHQKEFAARLAELRNPLDGLVKAVKALK